MSSENSNMIVSRNFSQTFEQMCNFMAVAKTGDRRETLRGLVKLCLLLFPHERYSEPQQICETIEAVFGIAVLRGHIQSIIDDLEAAGAISKPAGTNYVLSAEVAQELRNRVQDAVDLESVVKDTWFATLKSRHPSLSLDDAWTALQAYLSRTFRRHGVQAAALIDPTIDTPAEYEASLHAILKEAIRDHFAPAQHPEAHIALSGFLADVGADHYRTRYIVQSADGAFTFFLLGVSPDLAAQFRSRLSKLTLFLDTNFLFGILDLHQNSQVDVSQDLLRAIETHNLPFKLRYHEATEREMRSTIGYYASVLRSRTWAPSLSRAAAASRNLSGIEQVFHKRNAQNRLDFDEFLRPYEHLDQLLFQKNIKVYRTSEDRLMARNDLYHEYQKFLERHERGDKTYDTVMHDATVLDATRRLRTTANSSLEAGALLISCDYYLYRFDWESSRQGGRNACVLLPNIFWQAIRPYVGDDVNFEKAFAETFALPEFRAIGGGGSRACSKMLQILATYKDIPEETAAKMLSNDLLLDQLRTTRSSEEFEGFVEAAFVEENKVLLEEKAALAQRLQEGERKQEEKEKAHAAQQAEFAKERACFEESLKANRTQVAEFTQSVAEKERLAQVAAREARDAERARKAAADELEATTRGKRRAEKRAFIMSIVAGGTVGILLILAFELCVQLIPWNWMKNHNNALPLQIGISILLLLGSLGALVSEWRKWCWEAAIVPFFVCLLKLLGGGGGK